MEDKIREKIFELADEKYKEFHSSLCPGVDNIIGVRVPVLRKLAKEIASMPNWRECMNGIKDDYYEEVMLKGMILGLAKMDIDEFLMRVKEFIPKINNWAICDTFCAGLKATKKSEEKMWNFINKYINSEKEFEVRFAVVMMLDFYITDKYIDKVLSILNSIKHEGYYVRMAIAWAISICYIKYEEITFNYLKRCSLDDFTYNKALQKIMESYRVDKDKKEIIKKMKRI